MRTLVIASIAILMPTTALADPPEVYTTTCASCHGAAGAGDGVAAAALDPKPANFTDASFWEGKDDAYLTKVIKEGGAAVGKSPAMAPFGTVLKDEQIKEIVTWLNTLKPAK